MKNNGGALTAEIFETWFPDKPEVILLDFLKSSNEDMFFVVPIKDSTNKIIGHVNRDCANMLLSQFKILRGE
jgi:hypothetical protein